MSAPSQFKSNFKAFQAIVRHGYPIIHPVTGTKTGEVKQLMAEFGIHSGEYTVEDPITGQTSTFADIRGFFYDLDEDAKRKNWTEEEKEAVRSRLLALAEEWPEAVQVHSRIPQAKPWPTYDLVAEENVALLARDLGLAQEALAYEQENDARPAVIAALQDAVKDPVESEELTAA